jgi:ABC-type uncharacterized transport system involved in gliding motility auxiliary subunit
MKETNRSALVLTVALLFCVLFANLLSLRYFGRVDLTRDKKFTLAEVSRQTVASLDDVMAVTAYFSEGLPAPYSANSRYVRDLLEEYRAASNGRFAFEFKDPLAEESAADKEKKKEAVRDIFGQVLRQPTSVEQELGTLGIQPVEIRVLEEDQQQTKRAYMGLVVRYQNKHEVIPLVQDLDGLEKDLTTLMRKLRRVKTPVLGLVKASFIPEMNRFQKAASESAQIKDLDLKTSKEIPEDVDALIIVGTLEGGADAKRVVQAFMDKGKSVAWFLDRYEIDPRSFEGKDVPKDGREAAKEILAPFGVELGDALIADIQCASMTVNEKRGGFTMQMPVRYPFIPEISDMDRANPLTRSVPSIFLPFVTSVNVAKEKITGIDAAVLAKTSKKSWTEEGMPNLNPKREWRRDEVKPNGPYSVAVAMTKRALAAGDAKEKNAQTAENRVLVLGSSGLLWDSFFGGSNQALVLNIVDWLFADSALLAMRVRELSDVPISQDIPDSVKQVLKYGNALGVPTLLIVIGLIRWRMRERRRHTIAL